MVSYKGMSKRELKQGQRNSARQQKFIDEQQSSVYKKQAKELKQYARLNRSMAVNDITDTDIASSKQQAARKKKPTRRSKRRNGGLFKQHQLLFTFITLGVLFSCGIPQVGATPSTGLRKSSSSTLTLRGDCNMTSYAPVNTSLSHQYYQPLTLNPALQRLEVAPQPNGFSFGLAMHEIEVPSIFQGLDEKIAHAADAIGSNIMGVWKQIKGFVSPKCTAQLYDFNLDIDPENRKSGDSAGDFYRDSAGDKFLIKECSDKLPANCLYEVVASNIYRMIVPKMASLDPVFLVCDGFFAAKRYIASKWHDGFETIGRRLSESETEFKFNNSVLSGSVMAVAAALFVGDTDFNDGNVGTLDNHFTKIDFGHSFQLPKKLNRFYKHGFLLRECNVQNINYKCMSNLIWEFHFRQYNAKLNAEAYNEELLESFDKILAVPQHEIEDVVFKISDEFHGVVFTSARDQMIKTLRQNRAIFQEINDKGECDTGSYRQRAIFELGLSEKYMMGLLPADQSPRAVT